MKVLAMLITLCESHCDSHYELVKLVCANKVSYENLWDLHSIKLLCWPFKKKERLLGKPWSLLLESLLGWRFDFKVCQVTTWCMVALDSSVESSPEKSIWDPKSRPSEFDSGFFSEMMGNDGQLAPRSSLFSIKMCVLGEFSGRTKVRGKLRQHFLNLILSNSLKFKISILYLFVYGRNSSLHTPDSAVCVFEAVRMPGIFRVLPKQGTLLAALQSCKFDTSAGHTKPRRLSAVAFG